MPMIYFQFIRKKHKRIIGKSGAGFTLLEMLLYIGLTTFLLASVIASAYPLFTNAERFSARTTSDIETAFAVQKISWALSGVATVNMPVSGDSGGTLSVTVVSGGDYSFRLENNAIETSDDGGTTWTPLTASRASIGNLLFTHIAPTGGAPRAIEVSFDVNSIPVGPLIYYARF